MHAQGWVHREVKPDNILFNKSSKLRLIDFSLTTQAAGACRSSSGKEKSFKERGRISHETILKARRRRKQTSTAWESHCLNSRGRAPVSGTSPDDLLKKHLTSAAPPSFGLQR